MSDDPRLYHELAYLWPIISASEEYAGKQSAAVKKFHHEAMIACRARMLESGKEAPWTLKIRYPALQQTKADFRTASCPGTPFR